MGVVTAKAARLGAKNWVGFWPELQALQLIELLINLGEP